jgi:hypothetical protein
MVIAAVFWKVHGTAVFVVTVEAILRMGHLDVVFVAQIAAVLCKENDAILFEERSTALC